MKKLLLLCMLFFIPLTALAQEETVLSGNVNFDWLTKSQLERDSNIDVIKNIIYSDKIIVKYSNKDFKNMYKNYLKDVNYKENVSAILHNKKEFGDNNLSGFFIAKDRILYAYGVQSKLTPNTIYYYDAKGNLRYIDKLSENYPTYPYYSHQYRVNGKLAGSIYFTDVDTQYVYNKGKFNGVWFKNTMFDSKAKKMMTRTNY